MAHCTYKQCLGGALHPSQAAGTPVLDPSCEHVIHSSIARTGASLRALPASLPSFFIHSRRSMHACIDRSSGRSVLLVDLLTAVTHLAWIWNTVSIWDMYLVGGDQRGYFASGNKISVSGRVVLKVVCGPIKGWKQGAH